MKIIYARQSISEDDSPSIFLAGPTPRDVFVKSWRPEAIEILNALNFQGVIFVPEDEDGKWEWKGLSKASVIVFWIPRELKFMPAFTTNIEWGKWYESGKVVLGYPEKTPKMSYFAYCAKKNNIPISSTLIDTLKSALIKLL